MASAAIPETVSDVNSDASPVSRSIDETEIITAMTLRATDMSRIKKGRSFAALAARLITRFIVSSIRNVDATIAIDPTIRYNSVVNYILRF